MKLVLSQAVPTDGDIERAFDHVAMLLAVAQAARAGMVLLPELYLPGYNRPDLHVTAQPVEPWIARLRGMARAAGVGVTLGWAECAGGARYNSALAIGPDGGILAQYRKIQLFGPMERASFQAENAPPPVFELGGRRFGLLICYDIEFSAHAADLARRGAEVVLVPTANPAGFGHVQEVLVPARAHESALVVAYANYCGAEAGLAFGGGSVIVGPDARPIATAGQGEAVLIANLPRREDYPSWLISTQLQDFRRAGTE